MMDRIGRRLSTCSSWLSYSIRLEMVNSMITTITTYVMGTIKLPKGLSKGLIEQENNASGDAKLKRIREAIWLLGKLLRCPRKKDG